MDSSAVCWFGLILVLFVTTFDVFWCCVVVFSVLALLCGVISWLYVYKGDVENFYRIGANKNNPLTAQRTSDGGIEEVVKLVCSPKKALKQDQRVTGSELIDNSLQEILGYIVRDYVIPWYNLISIDNEFPEVTVKITAQTLAINVSNKVKDIDWIPYLTTRLVDDAASHLRLFKQARAKVKALEKHKTPKSSPHRDLNRSPKRAHKRNKSETDIRYYGRKPINEAKVVPDSEHVSGNSKFYDTKTKANANTLENYFFDLECQMEKDLICRDLVCTDANSEREFLCELVELLLYILLPDEDFQCKPLRFVLRELFVNCVILPLFSTISDPDYINQAIIWLCLRETSLPSEVFLTTLRLSDNCDELLATKELASKEIQQLRSRDSGGDSDLSIKQQLSSLTYVVKLVDNRLAKLDNLGSTDSGGSIENSRMETAEKINLPLDVILKNNVALSYFIDYISSRGKQAYLFFYLNIEGWKLSVEQQLSDLHSDKPKPQTESISYLNETIRSTAYSMYDQYLGDRSETKLDLKPALVQQLFFKIRNLNEPPSELWFEDVQHAIYERLRDDHLPGFKRSAAYVKLLEELDLLQQNVGDEDSLSLSSLEGACIEEEDARRQHVNLRHVRSFSDVPLMRAETTREAGHSNGKADEKEMKTDSFSLAVDIIETGIVCEKGKMFGIYATRVTKRYDSGHEEEWHIYRRYSDFYDLHSRVKEKYPDLSKLTFPGKKTFHNMDRAVLERRMRMLGAYMKELCQPNVLSRHVGLKELLMVFLEQGEYDRKASGLMANAIDTLKSGMRTIKNMPEQLINTVDEVVEGLTKVFQGKPGRVQEASKVGASIDIESDDNIPLRIMLLLMDEVFDLKSRNQWLRRRIVTLLRQIVRTMFGDIVNRRILDFVSYITSPRNVANYLHVFKQSFWPNGVKADRKPERDSETKHRTRIAAKVALLSCLSDELKHIIGSETTRRGLLTVFELFQRPTLNRRLLYVLLEGIVCTLFPEKNFVEIFQKFHSKSKRISGRTR